LNTVLYAAIGYLILVARKKTDSPDGEKPPSIIQGN